MHYYRFNIADWHLGTSHLSLEEEAAYLRLVNFYYDTEKPIPLETDMVFRRLRLGKGSELGSQILSEFFTKTEEGWIHQRCDKEIESYQEKADANRENGKKGGRPPKNKDLHNNPEKPSGLSSETQSKPTQNLNQEPLTKNHKPVNNKDKGGSRTGSSPVTFTGWLGRLDDKGEKPIPLDDKVFDYAAEAGIPREYLLAMWTEFKARYKDSDKRYKDWRATFRNAVRGNWYKLWWHDGDGYRLTSLGQQAITALNGADKNAK